ncbi:MAG TPA: DUF4184 family protein [Verrucomicrobiae bacterium]|jgi:hypothetical protein|nr:DUF4184 family protein [Verrucomicrobiae bacterium]
MPFTLAHPAAVVPFAKLLGKHVAFSALVIGSMTPDFAYLVPGLTRRPSHSLGGLFWFCLPMGLTVYLVFHLLLKRPLAAALPRSLREAVTPVVARTPGLPPARWLTVVLCLLLGALTHITWDLFTHPGPIVRAFPVLAENLATLGWYRVYVYKVLQHGSTLLGLALLARWTRAWVHEASVRPGV